MLYRFKSRETSDIVMLAPDAERLLAILGKTAKLPGIITWPEMGHCIELLQQQAALEAAQGVNSPESEEHGDDANATRVGEGHSHVSLAQRIVPFVHALERCRLAEVDLTWQV